MTQFKYLIIGGGMAADSAAKGIRTIDPTGSIGMITEESVPPYDRPPLSKGLWKGKPLSGIWRQTEARDVTVICLRKAVSLDPAKKEVVDDHGTIYHYERLLLATGGTPRRHPDDDSAPIYFRTLKDYQALRSLSVEKQRFIVVGGGFIGSEVAAALAMNGRTVTLVFPDSGICGRILPAGLSHYMNRYYEEKGVRVLPGRSVTSMTRIANGAQVHLSDGTTLGGDAVIAGLGIIPNTDLASRAGLATGNGITVDAHMQTSHADIYAAGDVASFPCPVLNKQVRMEHENNANATGTLAGRNMAGCSEAHVNISYFYSDMFDLGYEAIGETDPTHRTVIEWLEPDRTGVIFYMETDKVRGILLWNMFGHLDAARELLRAQRPSRDADLKSWTRELKVS